MADARSARGGGIPSSLGGGQTNLVPTTSGGDPGAGIVTNTPADWFGPANPMKPSAPAEVTGRRWDFPVAMNLQQRPRAYELIDFPTLRALSRSYDLLRLVIETRKDQLATLEWTIVLKDKKAKVTPEQKTRIEAIEAFFQKPDKVHDWDTWLRLILEDLFVLDAPTIYRRKTRGGQLYGYKVMDGATFKRVVDDWGDAPLPPYPAFQQVLKGLGAVNYNTDQIVYKPRNPMTDKLYGFGPVEQVIAIVNIGLRRETWQLNYFTEGNLPDALIGTPNEWTPDQIRNFQDWFDARLSGNLGNRRGATFVPGDVAKGIVQTKETELFGQAEEWLARVICFAFSISPQAFVKMMNRATAGTAKETSEQEGLEPLKKWIKTLIDDFIRTDFASTDLQFGWLEEVEIDPKVQNDIIDSKVKSGRLTLNEARDIDGQDPYGDDVPEAAQPLIITATGPVPVSNELAIQQQKDKLDAMPPPPPMAGPGVAGGPAKPAPAGGPRRGSGTPSGGGAGSGGGGGKGPAKAASPEVYPPSLAKAIDPSVSPERPLARRVERSMAKVLTKALADAGDDIAHQVSKLLGAAKAAKVEDGEQHGSVNLNPEIDTILAQLDLSSFDVIPDAIEEGLYDLASDTAQKAIAQVGAKAEQGLVNQVNEKAVDYARTRSAELVGKSWTTDGQLIDNPNAKMAITEGTRDALRSTIEKGLADNIGTPAIADAIQDSYGFSKQRAELIAHTEVRFANEQSKLDGWRAAGEYGVVVKKAWDADAEACDICLTNQDAGAIDLDEDFPSGDDAAPAHPNCECVTVPEVQETSEESDGGEDA